MTNQIRIPTGTSVDDIVDQVNGRLNDHLRMRVEFIPDEMPWFIGTGSYAKKEGEPVFHQGPPVDQVTRRLTLQYEVGKYSNDGNSVYMDISKR